ncbi:aromatic ring-hydroxylating dioxygenase subunit alpha [Sphingopyxis sp.]|uniref:aromatic ring-hydroxylating oxygenase subunit alpha n=1 Tax=Sphingopyxis sp. TaxID=1908224 RepID=UPI002D781207|nr:aromatic ring-hydroxylating dioxygenase subunit alpha [Sphingopyxis sp.]HET6523090.1 aromatic ring-hydroxylating dioxygenase subunit alpha [Sphingopyxis sp.]
MDNGDFAHYVNWEKGTVSRRIFSDAEIYATELKQIFARAWLYLGHESEIPGPGDFVHTYMGEEPIILWRDKQGQIGAYINSCRHRGNRVCRVDRGNAKSFACAYHGWTFASDGKLIGAPGIREDYKEALDRSKWGLIKVAKLGIYGGLIFGTFDAEAPSLDDYLGDMRWGMDILLGQGDMVAAPGTVRWRIKSNWKFASDNAVDYYHGAWTHRSGILSGHAGGTGTLILDKLRNPKGTTLVAGYGHGVNADYAETELHDWDNPLAAWRRDPVVQERLGPTRASFSRANMLVFPNLFINSGSRDLMVRHPRGPGEIEISKTVLVSKADAEEVQHAQVRAANRHFGPAGMFEQDDGENWSSSTEAASGAVSSDYDLNFSMGVDHAAFIYPEDAPPLLNTLTNEHGQMWMYRAWAEFMDAEDWSSLAANHVEPQEAFGKR